MRIYVTLLIYLFAVLSGAQKNEGLILQKKTYTALLPLGQTIVINETDDRQSIRGELFNVSQKVIYLKDITTSETTSIPIEKVKEIKSFAKSKKFENFKTGYGVGAKFATIATSGAIAILAIGNPEAVLGIFFVMIIVPPASIAGGTLNGLINISRATYEINNTDLYKIDNDNWRIKFPDDSKKGFRKFFSST
tara:strand:- start:260 stop:838 length:579 start_codon:yes stop_codon:yes gene_type:complete